MKLTLSWLKDHLDTTASLSEICDRLTGLGLEVEGVSDRAAALTPFKVAHVLEASIEESKDVSVESTGLEQSLKYVESMDRTVEAAKKEGKGVFYGTWSDDQIRPILAAWNKTYSDIKLEFVNLRGAEAL